MPVINKLKYFILPVEDIDRAKSFYLRTFGWDIDEDENIDGYHTIEVGDGEDYEGYFVKSKDISKLNKQLIIGVKSVDAKISLIEKNGGEIVEEPKKLNKKGNVAYFKDTEGNILGLMDSIYEDGHMEKQDSTF
jgi:predicted enzyme related to lactoylglutathione lyase